MGKPFFIKRKVGSIAALILKILLHHMNIHLQTEDKITPNVVKNNHCVQSIKAEDKGEC